LRLKQAFRFKSIYKQIYLAWSRIWLDVWKIFNNSKDAAITFRNKVSYLLCSLFSCGSHVRKACLKWKNKNWISKIVGNARRSSQYNKFWGNHDIRRRFIL